MFHKLLVRIHERVNDMSNNNNHHGSNCNCIAEILNVILVLQQNACPENCLDSCDRPVLGGGPNCLICNTRPITLYTCSCCNTPLSMPVAKDCVADCDDNTMHSRKCSNVFRIEKLDGNCATFRVLQDNPEKTSLNPFVATNSFFIMDLSCVCAIRCLSDTFVECV